jgi:hypothetical protein
LVSTPGVVEDELDEAESSEPPQAESMMLADSADKSHRAWAFFKYIPCNP